MAVEIFSKDDFENALPRNKVDGTPLCRALGIVQGEYAYMLPVTPTVGIMIRSSVGESGRSAGTGEDSIRLWIADPATGKPLGSKLSRWIARTGDWRGRLVEQARTLYALGKRLGACPECGAQLAIFKVKKEGPNKGRLFVKCSCGKHFEWVD